MASTASIVIEKFGGISKLARALKHPHVTTVQGWKTRGVIPARQQGAVLKAAEAAGIDITANDLIDMREAS